MDRWMLQCLHLLTDAQLLPGRSLGACSAPARARSSSHGSPQHFQTIFGERGPEVWVEAGWVGGGSGASPGRGVRARGEAAAARLPWGAES